MKNLVYQYYLPPNSKTTIPRWLPYGVKSAQEYSISIGCDYNFHRTPYMNSKLIVFESLRVLFDPYFDQYDNVLLLDVDMLINTKDNIFDIEVEDIGMVHEAGYRTRPAIPEAKFDEKFWQNYFYGAAGVITYARKYLQEDFTWKKSKLYPDEDIMLNGGLQLWSKEGRMKCRELFGREEHTHFSQNCNGKGETPYLNMKFIHHNISVTELSTEWNRLNFQWKADNNKGKITHYNDYDKSIMIKDSVK